MRKRSTKHSGFFDPRVFIGFLLFFGASLLAFTGFGIPVDAQAPPRPQIIASPNAGKPDIIQMVGPFSEDRDLRSLPYIPPNMEEEEVRLMRHPPPLTPSTEPSDPVQKVRESIARTIAMPTPISTFAGMGSGDTCGTCLPPDT